MKNLIENIKRITNKQAILGIVIVGVFVYGNTLVNEMFWDDFDSVIGNEYIRSWEHLPKYFSENLIAGAGVNSNYWRPLLLFSFSIDFKIGGLEPFMYHLQNMFWHILASVLVFVLARKLSFSVIAGFIAGLLFLVHPLQTEAVTYVAGRADPMHTALMLLGFIFFIKATKKYFNRKYFIFSILFFVLALLVKERAVVFPVLLSVYLVTLYDKTFFGQWKKKLFLILPFIAVTVLYLILRMSVLHFSDTFDIGAEDTIGSPNFYHQMLIYAKGISVYTGLIFWPENLYMEKTITNPTSFFDTYVFWCLVIMASIVFGIKRSFAGDRVFAFGMLYFFAALLPSLYVFPIQGLLYEHWLYPALPGLFIVVGYYLDKFISKQKNEKVIAIIFVVIVCVLVAFCVRTIKRNVDWQDQVRFFEKNVELGGVSGRVYTNLGLAYSDAGDEEKAIEAYKEATKLNDEIFHPWYNMGNTYKEMGQNDKALEMYKNALSRNLNFLATYNNIASIYIKQEKYDDAIEVLNEALVRFPENESLLHNMSVVYSYKNKNKTTE